MLKYVEGDIFHSPAQVLVNTVNTVGVMGKGIALSFKKRYPEMFERYRKTCDEHKLTIGKLILWYGPDHWVLDFPTKENWRNPSKLSYIEDGLKTFCRKYADYNITSIAFPRLGCGNGELKWDDVKPLMEKYLKDLPIDVFVYLGPGEATMPEHRSQKKMDSWLKEHARDMSFAGIRDELSYHCSLVPVEFMLDDTKWLAQWKEETSTLVFTKKEGQGQPISVDESVLQEIWDYIQNTCIFRISDKLENNLVYYLLFSMGYLTIARIQDSGTEQMYDGYQLDAGSGRYFLVRGTES